MRASSLLSGTEKIGTINTDPNILGLWGHGFLIRFLHYSLRARRHVKKSTRPKVQGDPCEFDVCFQCKHKDY